MPRSGFARALALAVSCCATAENPASTDASPSSPGDPVKAAGKLIRQENPFLRGYEVDVPYDFSSSPTSLEYNPSSHLHNRPPPAGQATESHGAHFLASFFSGVNVKSHLQDQELDRTPRGRNGAPVRTAAKSGRRPRATNNRSEQLEVLSRRSSSCAEDERFGVIPKNSVCGYTTSAEAHAGCQRKGDSQGSLNADGYGTDPGVEFMFVTQFAGFTTFSYSGTNKGPVGFDAYTTGGTSCQHQGVFFYAQDVGGREVCRKACNNVANCQHFAHGETSAHPHTNWCTLFNACEIAADGPASENGWLPVVQSSQVSTSTKYPVEVYSCGRLVACSASDCNRSEGFVVKTPPRSFFCPTASSTCAGVAAPAECCDELPSCIGKECAASANVRDKPDKADLFCSAMDASTCEDDCCEGLPPCAETECALTAGLKEKTDYGTLFCNDMDGTTTCEEACCEPLPSCSLTPCDTASGFKDKCHKADLTCNEESSVSCESQCCDKLPDCSLEFGTDALCAAAQSGPRELQWEINGAPVDRSAFSSIFPCCQGTTFHATLGASVYACDGLGNGGVENKLLASTADRVGALYGEAPTAITSAKIQFAMSHLGGTEFSVVLQGANGNELLLGMDHGPNKNFWIEGNLVAGGAREFDVNSMQVTQMMTFEYTSTATHLEVTLNRETPWPAQIALPTDTEVTKIGFRPHHATVYIASDGGGSPSASSLVAQNMLIRRSSAIASDDEDDDPVGGGWVSKAAATFSSSLYCNDADVGCTKEQCCDCTNPDGCTEPEADGDADARVAGAREETPGSVAGSGGGGGLSTGAILLLAFSGIALIGGVALVNYGGLELPSDAIFRYEATTPET
eukprot:CAMPEP_0178994496 /NCGR_PEP_ID=MMETSP0795-20121207/7304_1 /TAXON_ID=88552 /ORGANISM="Amoebophrya sp., Strain Ameob2" /LENGTH=854 /DNA_ID=CAMNT_0020686699 /DNA_START=283 /DNA_END=2847 /DNA_ORIENTATION=+